MARAQTVDKRRGQTRVERVLNKNNKPKDGRWFLEEQCHNTLFGQLERLRRITASRRRQDVYYACLYDDSEFASLLQGSQAIGEFTPQTMTTNIVKRQVDAFVAKHTKNRPKPMCMPNGGNYGEQRRAKSLSKVFDGVLDEVGYWDTRPQLRRDGAVFGSGIALNYRVGRELFHDRTYSWEWLVDPREAMYGKPQNLYLIRYMDKLVLMERYPEHAEAIMNAEGRSSDDTWNIGWDETSDQVLTVWAWHLPTGKVTDKDAKTGSHALCVSTATLSHVEYRRDYFPISKWDFYKSIVGWWGTGMAQQLAGLQYEVNSVGLRLQEQGYMAGTFVWTPSNDDFESEQIDNGVFTHIVCPHKPEFFNPSPFHPQFFEWYQNLRGRFPAEETRLSEMATRGEKPPGLESGVALRAWNNLDDEAFLPQGREDERDSCDTGWQFFDLLEEIHEEGTTGKNKEPYTIRIEKREHGQTFLEDADWAKVRMDRAAFKLKAYPTSLLQGTPAEQLQSAQDLAAKGLLSIDEIYALVDIPDVQRVLNLRGAPRRAIEKILQKILDSDDPESVFVQPESAMNLELCRALGLMTYLDAYTNDAEPKNLKWVLEFALQAELELESTEDAAAQGMPQQQAPVDSMDEMGMGGGQTFAPPDPNQPMLPSTAVAPTAVAGVPQM